MSVQAFHVISKTCTDNLLASPKVPLFVILTPASPLDIKTNVCEIHTVVQPRQSFVHKHLCSSLGLLDEFIVTINVSSLVCKVKKLKGAYCIEKTYIITVEVDVKQKHVAQTYELYEEYR